MDDYTYSAVYSNVPEKRAGLIYSQTYPDFGYAWLGMKNTAGFQNQPFDSDIIMPDRSQYRAGINFGDLSLTAAWNSTNIQTVVYLDIQKSSMSNNYIDSVSNSVQYIGLSGGDAIGFGTGALDKNTSGDLNKDGFNESEGAYVIKADNNIVNFYLPARNDTCRFYPAFRITDYYASSKPQYVFLYNSTGDTIPLIEGYQYNVYHNKISRELVIQIDSVFCGSVGVFISADRTLAVKMSAFWAKGGIACDTIGWRTESEQENLGYYLFRRIKPAFYEGIQSDRDTLSGATERSSFPKKKMIAAADTGWVRLNKTIIPGASSGVSFGPRDYSYIDKNVFSSVVYEYKLIAVDYSNREEEYGPVEAIPLKRLQVFNLGLNYPNPFRRLTVIRFDLPIEMCVSLNIYNISGRLVRRLIAPTKSLTADSHKIAWDGADDRGAQLAPGPYIYRFKAKEYVKSRVMIKLE